MQADRLAQGVPVSRGRVGMRCRGVDCSVHSMVRRGDSVVLSSDLATGRAAGSGQLRLVPDGA